MLDERDYALQDANWNTTALVGYQPIPADGNADGTVNNADLVTFFNHDGLTAGGSAAGDFNNDGVVNAADLVILFNHYGTTGTGNWQLQERFSYSPYGVVSAFTPSFASRSDFLAWNVGFQGMLYDTTTKLNFTLSRIYEASTGRFLTVDPAHADGMDWYRGFADNPINSTDWTGLFDSSVHADLVREAAHGLSFRQDAISEIVEADVDTDYPPTYWDDSFHAQAMGWLDNASRLLKNVKTDVCNQYTNGMSLGFVGTALHILQDFYSHTDWEDGRNMHSLYTHYGDADSRALDTQSASHPPHHGTIIPVSDILTPNYKYQLVTYFEGGGGLSGPWVHFFGDNSAHSRYSVDNAGKGRDRVVVDGVAYGIVGAFDAARRDAQKQTREILEWFKQNVPPCCYSRYFTDGFGNGRPLFNDYPYELT